ncbi:ABC transporter ATP-binding protein [Streptococcus merionis]|uniref:ATP-binding cassette domain-containing protein n=1 Tax=Streptococcus merionis TaxID=400065 RepID=UPI0026F1A6B7|nr:ABC transporter ATP-binding protein [Streptococcus merionis]
MSITHYIFRCKRQNIVLLVWTILNSLCVLGNGLTSAQALTSLVNLNIRQFLLWCGIQLIINIIWMVQIKQVVPARERALQAMNQVMRADISDRIAKAGYQNYHKYTQDSYASWMTYDMETLNDMGFEVLELMISQILNITVGILTLVIYHPSFVVTIILFANLMVLAPKVFSKRLSEQAVAFTQKNEALLNQISDVLSGYTVLLGANKLHHIGQKISQCGTAYADSKVSYAKTFGNMMAIQNGTSFISQIAIIAQAGFLYSLHRVPIGSVSSAPYFASIIFPSLTGFFANYAELKNCQAIFEKWQSLETTDEFETEVQLDFSNNLEISNLKLQLGNTQIALPDLLIKPGDKIAIVGPSGSGKSSLLKTLVKHYLPHSGKITLDHQNYQKLPSHQVQSLVSLVSQNAYLFKDSLRYNLTLGHEISDETLLQTLNQVQMADWLANQPEGFNSHIDPAQLSGGQKQRLCLARALLENKPILLLDEASSALDKVNRQRIEQLLLNQADKTILLVTHQLSPETEALCNQVLYVG